MKIRIGTRRSELACRQAALAQIAIEEKYGYEIEIVTIKTAGDKIQNRSLADCGGKGLFVKEIEQALIDEKIEIAVHSLKDLPGNISEINEKLTLAGFLKREDPRDVFISNHHQNIDSLPYQAVLGTCSPRKSIQLRQDLQIKTLRGNVKTRIKKAQNFDGIILALAGLKRLNLVDHITEIISTDKILPAIGQGIIGLQCNRKNKKIIEILNNITHEETNIVTQTERSFLTQINGDCHTPVAGLATVKDGRIYFKGMLGVNEIPNYIIKTGDIKDASEIGVEAAMELLKG